jgi:hypothetical protein
MRQQGILGEDNPLVDRVIKPVVQIGTLSTNAIRASRIKPCINRPYIRLQTSVDTSCYESLRSWRRPYKGRLPWHGNVPMPQPPAHCQNESAVCLQPTKGTAKETPQTEHVHHEQVATYSR